MSGPIVRSGPSEKFSNNWDKVFAGGAAAEATKTAAKKSTKAKPAKTAKKAKKK